MSEPHRIWLQLYGDASPEDGDVDYTHGDVTWCWEPIFEHDLEYIRVPDDELVKRVQGRMESLYGERELNGALGRDQCAELKLLRDLLTWIEGEQP